MTTHTVGSLFSGVGGFEAGMEQAGYECRFQVEWDKHCTNILNRHWPTVPKWGDITEVHGKDLPPVDVIVWGSPCQDLSVAGKRAGLDGGRSGLFFEGIRIINEMREATNGQYPRISVWENVAGALSSNQGADFGVILDEMAKAGAMVIEYALLDAQHFGVPQRRRRVFVVAIFDPATASRCPDPLLPVCKSLSRYFASGKQKGKDTASEVAAGFGSSNYGGWQETDTAITLSARDAKSGNTLAVETVITPEMVVRRLTPLECERLMGWPDDHTRWNADGSEQADSHRYKQCGNGVASPVAAWIGGHLMKLDQP